MAHPFPPGSTPLVLSPLPYPPAPLYIIIHITIEGGEPGKGWIPPFCYAQTPGQTHNRGPR